MKTLVLLILTIFASSVMAADVELEDQARTAVIEQLKTAKPGVFKSTYAVDNLKFRYRRFKVADRSLVGELAKSGTAMFFQCESRDGISAGCNIFISGLETSKPMINLTVELDISNRSAPKLLNVIQVMILFNSYNRTCPESLTAQK